MFNLTEAAKKNTALRNQEMLVCLQPYLDIRRIPN